MLIKVFGSEPFNPDNIIRLSYAGPEEAREGITYNGPTPGARYYYSFGGTPGGTKATMIDDYEYFFKEKSLMEVWEEINKQLSKDK